jgi:hypothetical protein
MPARATHICLGGPACGGHAAGVKKCREATPCNAAIRHNARACQYNQDEHKLGRMQCAEPSSSSDCARLLLDCSLATLQLRMSGHQRAWLGLFQQPMCRCHGRAWAWPQAHTCLCSNLVPPRLGQRRRPPPGLSAVRKSECEPRGVRSLGLTARGTRGCVCPI